MEKINLKDFTFLIPLRIDSVSRLENILIGIEYIQSNFDTNISVLESSVRNTKLLRRLLPNDITYQFVEDLDNIFHRTKYINQLVGTCDTECIVVWDTDIIIPIGQIKESVDLIRLRKADFVTPFKDKFLDTSDLLRDLYIQTRDISILKLHQGKMKSLYNPNPVGGAFFAHKQTYIDAGMENEKFYGWGREDGDRINRWNIMGFKHKHVEGVLYHLSHERGKNSTFHSPNQDNRKMTEIYRSLSMSKKELEREIGNWGKS